MQTKRYEFIMEASSPLAHASENLGNHSIAMRRKVRQPDGTFADVPIVTGDTARHQLREAAAYAYLDAAGLLDSGQLSESALRLLFSGGQMTGRGDTGTVNLDEYRELCELCPPLALFGGCAANRVIPGRLQVDEMTLICKETEHYAPEWAKEALGGQVISSCRAHIEEAQRVRMDPMLDPGKRKLLSDGAQVAANARLEASAEAHTKDDAIQRDDAKSTMLPRTFERVVQGSLFHWAISATCYSELDVDTLMVAIGVFMARPTVGGKRATGHGQLRCVAARDITVLRPAEAAQVVDVTALGGRVGSLFRAHVTERKDRIVEFLGRIAA